VRRAKREQTIIEVPDAPPDAVIAAGIREVRHALERAAELGGYPVLYPIDLGKSKFTEFAVWGTVALCIADAFHLSSDELRELECVLVKRSQTELF
jgi:hypothetical protein